MLAYHHTKPFWPVHIVVVPKKHINSLRTLEDKQLILEIQQVLQQVAKRVTEENGSYRILTNLGDYQDSKHLHYHIYYGEKIR